MTPWFIATQRFDPADGESWSKYIAWSGLSQLKEVVSLDGMLCPTLLPEIRDEYWPHIVNENFMLNFFIDHDYLVEQVRKTERKNVLCVLRNPESEPTSPPISGFQFLGYDLIEREGSVSALTNCGGFPDAFSNSELSKEGLLPSLKRASEVRNNLLALHPESHHANCNLWAIFRSVE